MSELCILLSSPLRKVSEGDENGDSEVSGGTVAVDEGQGSVARFDAGC